MQMPPSEDMLGTQTAPKRAFFWGYFSLFPKPRSAICNALSWLPPLSFFFILCVMVLHEPSLTHISPCKFPKSLELGNFGADSAVQGVWGNTDGSGHVRGCWAGMSLKRAQQAWKGFRGVIRGGVAGIVLGVPQYASFFGSFYWCPSCMGGSLGLGPRRPPPAPPSLEIGRKVLDHRRQRRRKQFLLDVAKGENVFSPHVTILNILGIFRRLQKWTKSRTFQLAENQYPISEH